MEQNENDNDNILTEFARKTMLDYIKSEKELEKEYNLLKALYYKLNKTEKKLIYDLECIRKNLGEYA
jgi:hypothetical protein